MCAEKAETNPPCLYERLVADGASHGGVRAPVSLSVKPTDAVSTVTAGDAYVWLM
jgi:hypothetical protein